MVEMYCRAHHLADAGTCPDCEELTRHAERKIDRCPLREGRTVCATCPVHCYRGDMRDRIREIMRYSGPRMILRHPWLGLLHLLDSIRRPSVA